MVRRSVRWSALAGALLAACAGIPEPPPPIAVEAPAFHPNLFDGPTCGSGVFETLGPRYSLSPVAPPPPERLWLPPGLRVRPERPAEGTAVVVEVRQPPLGREPLSVEAELAGHPVSLARTPDGWFGVGAVPIGAAGGQFLVARFEVGPDSTVEHVLPVSVSARAFPATRLSVASRFTNPPAEVLERIRDERQRIRAALAETTPQWIPRGPFVWPRAPRVTSPFGQRRVFNGELQSRHWGLDLEGREGSLVRAAAGGRVALAGDFYYQGNAVYLDHGLAVYTGYFHLSRIDVEEGDYVEPGQVLGRVGATGRVTGPHLHWTLHVGGVSLDPASLLELPVP